MVSLGDRGDMEVRLISNAYQGAGKVSWLLVQTVSGFDLFLSRKV